VNPNHLFIGTAKDNAQDMKAKDRHLYGERNAEAKLTEGQAFQIHARSAKGEGSYKIAKAFGISQTQVMRILHGKRWEHVSEAVRAIRGS
jgi:hypothetical protein